jgi:cyclic 2,3-diphosphoglycerate synthetase
LKPISGRRVFLVATAPEEAGNILEGYLEGNEGCTLVGRSYHLSDRRRLEEDLRGAERAEVLLTELKAAAVDVVTRFARESGKEVVYFHNKPIAVNGEMGLEGFFETIWNKVAERSCQTKRQSGKTG